MSFKRRLKMNKHFSLGVSAYFLSFLMFFVTIQPTYVLAKDYKTLFLVKEDVQHSWISDSIQVTEKTTDLSENIITSEMEEEIETDEIKSILISKQLVAPGGPDQPEVQSFTPAGVDDMVDPFTGDFTYNIPLMEVDGYPINLSYSAGIGMEQEASWVGLGWNLNPGVINRSMRGIPDDFNGKDKIHQEYNQANNWTAGVTSGFNFELFGFDFAAADLSISQSFEFNNYMGFSSSITFGPSFSIGKETGGNIGLQLSGGSQSGASIGMNVGFGEKNKKSNRIDSKISVGSSFNSRGGLQQLSMNVNFYDPNAEHIGKEKESRINRSVDPNIGTSFNLGMPTYVSHISHDTKMNSFTGRFKLGASVSGFDPSGSVEGFFSLSALASKSKSSKAYGYANLENGANNPYGMLDFNRENEGSFTKNTPALPIPILTYDIYSVSGDGVSGSYRMDRNDIGHVFDPMVTSASTAENLGLEVGLGNTFKAGGDISVAISNGISGVWKTGNDAANLLRYKKNRVQFREANELSYEANEQNFASIGGDKPGYFRLKSVDNISSDLVVPGIGTMTPNPSKGQNFKQNQPLTPFTVEQLRNGFGMTPLPTESYAYQNHNEVGHHIGAFLVTKTDGMRYYYGLPAYSIVQKNVSFATNNNPNVGTGRVTYSPTEASVNNKSGIDHHYSSQEIPAYAHTYMLSCVVSPDYVDIDNVPGPSKGDLGNYILFKYEHVDNYKWRNPYQSMEANYDLGLLTDKADTKGSFIYGEKELWYLDTIYTKNHVVVFEKSVRNDAVSVHGVNGGINTGSGSRMKKLDKIKLYSLPDFENNNQNAVPIQTVHFVYNETNGLCTNYISANGKLTLTKIYTTYEKSYRGEHVNYEFTYDYNPAYNSTNVDRWGTYKENPSTGALYPYGASQAVLNSDAPYSEQDKVLADLHASAWNLSKIKTPAGGIIEIIYESDDYAYVQHKRAQQMIQIVRVEGTTDNYSCISNNGNKNRKIYFELLPGTNPSDYARKGDEIYFRALLSMDKNKNDFDFVPGYATIDEIGEEGGQGYIKFKGAAMKKNDNDYNPMAVAGAQFARNYLPRMIPPSNQSSGVPTEDSDLSDIFSAIIGAYTSFGEFFTGPNKALWDRNIGNYLVVNKSWVRLNNPYYKKLGGGYRVKEIRMSDNWDNMVSNELTSYYGKEYIYEEDGKSTGVASYEPQIGGEENVWRTAVANNVELKLAPDMRNYMETPFGEQLFPSPSVGYSKVIVRNIQQDGVVRTATGHTVHEFYTTRDFPTITMRTAVKNVTEQKNLNVLLYANSVDKMAATQGFTIENNDMNGKPKSIKIYAEGQNEAYSSVEYFYKSKARHIDGVAANQLTNEVKVIKSNGHTATYTVGRTYEAIADFRENRSQTFSVGLGINTNGIWPVPPLILPMILPENLSRSKTEFRSAVFAKSIERKGILYKTVARDYNSVIETENLAFDSETGEVILTSVNNDYRDTVYNFTYPAHWIYEGMGQAYKNLGYESAQSYSFTQDGYCAQINNSKLYEGDELIVKQGNSYIKVWVVESGTQGVRLLDKSGIPVSGTISYLKVLRSGHRNLQTTPVGTLTLKKNPLNTISGNIFDNVLTAESILYGPAWKSYCDCNDSLVENPYVTGQKGNWNPKATYSYLTGRTQAFENTNTNIRKDGELTSFHPFFKLENGMWKIDQANWTTTADVTEFNPNGNAIETVDPLNRYSSVQYGYNQTLKVAAAQNAMKNENGFDGFEDYDFNSCSDKFFHLGENNITKVSNDFAHTGRFSIKVEGGSPVEFKRQINEACTGSDPCDFEQYIVGNNPEDGVYVMTSEGISMEITPCLCNVNNGQQGGSPIPHFEDVPGGVLLTFENLDDFTQYRFNVILTDEIHGCSFTIPYSKGFYQY